MTVSTSASRIVRASPAVIEFQGVDQYGEPADPGVVTVGVVNSKGDVVVSPGTASVGSGVSPRTYTFTVAQTANLDRLTATWTVTGTVVGVTSHEVVGGVYVSVADVRRLEPSLSEVPDYSSTTLVDARSQVEQMFEDVCGRAFVPRFRVDVLSGDGTRSLELHRPDVRAVRWVRVAGVEVTGESFVVDGRRVVRDGSVWPSGSLNIEVGYEYGLDRPPADLAHAAVQAIRAQVNTFRSGIPDRATSYQPAEGGNVILATPGIGPWVTAIPSVDEAIRRYRDDYVRVA